MIFAPKKNKRACTTIWHPRVSNISKDSAPMYEWNNISKRLFCLPSFLAQFLWVMLSRKRQLMWKIDSLREQSSFSTSFSSRNSKKLIHQHNIVVAKTNQAKIRVKNLTGTMGGFSTSFNQSSESSESAKSAESSEFSESSESSDSWEGFQHLLISRRSQVWEIIDRRTVCR